MMAQKTRVAVRKDLVLGNSPSSEWFLRGGKKPRAADGTRQRIPRGKPGCRPAAGRTHGSNAVSSTTECAATVA